MDKKGTKFLYDYFVIGGGSGGLASAKKAASLGKKVGIADFVKPSPYGTSWGLGGTCVNVGCIPKKLMHFTSSVGELRKDQAEAGWEVDEETPHNWERMRESVTNHIKSLNWGYRTQMMKMGIKYYNALASLSGPNTIKLVDKNDVVTEITAEHILVAVGGRPRYLNVPGAKEHCISSDDLFWLEKAPGKSLVIGAGYIATECGGFLNGLGKEVDILYRSEILRGFDKECVDKIVGFMTHYGVNFRKGNAYSFEKVDGRIKVTLTCEVDGKKVDSVEFYDTVLMAVGRYPDLGNLGLDNLGVELNDKGKVKVNEKWQTNVKGLYALGDIASHGLELTPVAIKEGQYLAEGLFGNRWKTIDYDTICTTIFTPMEYSVCGLTEAQAINKYGEDGVEVFYANSRPIEWQFDTSKPRTTYVKAIVHKENRKVVGLHYTGIHAGEVMQGYGIAMKCGLTWEEYKKTCAIHPTQSEGIVNLSQKKTSDQLIRN